VKNLQLLLHLQRLLDGELPDTGLDDLEDLGADDLEEGRSGGLDDLAPILEELDEMNEERDTSPDDLDADLDGLEDWLEPGAPPGGARARSGGGSGDLDRLEALLRSAPGRRAGRARPAGGTRRDARLQRLVRLLDDIDGDDDPVADDVRRLRRLASSRFSAGRAEGRRDPLDPVILRRRGQIREFLAAWRETLRAARRAERESDAPPGADAAPDAKTAPETGAAAPGSLGPRPVRSASRKTRGDQD